MQLGKVFIHWLIKIDLVPTLQGTILCAWEKQKFYSLDTYVI